MAKIKNNLAKRVPSVNDSALKRSAFQRRKQYAEQLKTNSLTSKATRDNNNTVTVSVAATNNRNQNVFFKAKAARRHTKAAQNTLTDLPKFKEMEELGCLPVSILSSGSGFRDRKAALSFSPHTQPFERTPIRGTPLRGMNLAGQHRTERVADVLTTLQRLKEALTNETATCAEVLTDLKGLELGRRSTVNDIAEFWMLKMQLLCKSGDRKEAIIAAVQAMFASTTQKVKVKLARQIGTLLDVEVTNGEAESDHENVDQVQADGQGGKSGTIEHSRSAKDMSMSEPDLNVSEVFNKENTIKDSYTQTIRSSQSKLSGTAALPERLYTSPDVKATPMVRTSLAGRGNSDNVVNEQFANLSWQSYEDPNHSHLLAIGKETSGQDLKFCQMKINHRDRYCQQDHIVFDCVQDETTEIAHMDFDESRYNSHCDTVLASASVQETPHTPQAFMDVKVRVVLYALAVVNIALGYVLCV
ncbi:hypothetical protein BIW11_09134 [Tropilaelaps mercedesae]|uniref:Uncharacterized protein n=1 Tax=Tropilaelaps mercedesae TaxID=418985 RepID=A0A1V9XLF3_9ACAR|nr:hypothetical protein BIW11_09134 [Tropilaelaps mercedesae]